MIVKTTATVLTLVPPLTTLPSASDTYAIYRSEVSCPNGAASETVSAGIDLRTLPTTTQSDTSVALTLNSITGSDPLLSSPTSFTAADFQISSSSPAKDAGTSTGAPSTDYFGTSRPQNSLFDIGFHEFGSSSTVPFSSLFFWW